MKLSVVIHNYSNYRFFSDSSLKFNVRDAFQRHSSAAAAVASLEFNGDV